MTEISPYHPELGSIWHKLSETGARNIAVVSAEPGEGTTAIAVALARRAGLSANAEELPEPDDEVCSLLIDLDIRRPSVNRVLGLRPKPGEIVRLDAIGVAALGDIGPAALESLRERTQLSERLRTWRSKFSVVVLLAAPLLSNDSDAIPGTVAAAAADACVLVTLAGRTSGNRIREAREKLTSAGANLIGSILNDRDNPSLLAELDRETYRIGRLFPRSMAGLRARLHRSPILNARL